MPYTATLTAIMIMIDAIHYNTATPYNTAIHYNTHSNHN